MTTVTREFEEAPGQNTTYERPKMRDGVLMEGWMKKKSHHGLPGLKPWKQRFFVLSSQDRELRYYGDVIESDIGRIPIDERCSIPINTIHSINVPDTNKYGSCRIDLNCDFEQFIGRKHPDSPSMSAHQPLHQSPNVQVGTYHTFSFLAPSIYERDEWVLHISDLMDSGERIPLHHRRHATTGKVINRSTLRPIPSVTSSTRHRTMQSETGLEQPPRQPQSAQSSSTNRATRPHIRPSQSDSHLLDHTNRHSGTSTHQLNALHAVSERRFPTSATAQPHGHSPRDYSPTEAMRGAGVALRT